MGKEKETRGFFDLKKQFIFYASYHNDPVSLTSFFLQNIHTENIHIDDLMTGKFYN